jgi:mycofactocin system glycosyltransferase
VTQRFSLDPSYRRPRAGRVVIGGSPLRLFTLGRAGEDIVAAIERGDSLPAQHDRLTDRLIDAGVLHPLLDDLAAVDDASVLTVVIPAHADTPRFRPIACRTIVVDDASDPPLHCPQSHTGIRSEVHRLDVNVGPGGARNAGLALVDTPFVAFVDVDVDVDEDQLITLLAHFADPRLAVVAPRVIAGGGTGALARFERRHSPLDRGAQPGRVAATTRVSFVPAAVIVCRTDALRAIGGFDATLRFGEDVDLVWRLVDAGHRCRYEPAVVAAHQVRPTLRAWVRQRVGYGSSAAPLARRHPGALAPMRMSGWSAASWAAMAAGLPVVGLTIGAGSTVALTRKLRSIPALDSLRLAGMGNLYAGRLVASTITRVWWPIALALALVSRRARRVAAAAVLVPAAIDWCTDRPRLDPLRYVAFRVLDDVAYGAGVWIGAARERSIDSLRPSFETWPDRTSSHVRSQ